MNNEDYLSQLRINQIKDRAKEKMEIQRLVEKAANFIGCADKSMWSLAVIDATLHHANFIRTEWESCMKVMSEKDAQIERLSAIINRQHDDCEQLKTKLEEKQEIIEQLCFDNKLNTIRRINHDTRTNPGRTP